MASATIIVIGAGIAGATAAAHLAAEHRVTLVEAEAQAGYHSTGRSAALWILNYGPPSVRMLTSLSRGFFEAPPDGFADAPIMSHRPVVNLAPPEQEAQLRRLLAEGLEVREIAISELRRMVPALRPDYAIAAAIETDAFDMDVAVLHQGFLRQLRARGGTLALRSRTGRIARRAGQWEVTLSDDTRVEADILVNAAGAWGDEVAEQAGLAPIGLVPKRRTGVVVDPAPWQPASWPMLGDVAHTWYARPEARTRLMLSPADETDTTPHDVQPDELDIAIAIDRVQQALDIDVRRVEHSWAGLRSFSPDRNFVLGWDGTAPGFFWNIGQGGYGIQTSPAAGRLVADLVAGRDPGPAGSVVGVIDPRRFAAAPLLSRMASP